MLSTAGSMAQSCRQQCTAKHTNRRGGRAGERAPRARPSSDGSKARAGDPVRAGDPAQAGGIGGPRSRPAEASVRAGPRATQRPVGLLRNQRAGCNLLSARAARSGSVRRRGGARSSAPVRAGRLLVPRRVARQFHDPPRDVSHGAATYAVAEARLSP